VWLFLSFLIRIPWSGFRLRAFPLEALLGLLQIPASRTWATSSTVLHPREYVGNVSSSTVNLHVITPHLVYHIGSSPHTDAPVLPRVPAVTHTVLPVVPLLTGDIPEGPLTPLYSPALATALIYYLSAHSVGPGVVALLVSVLTTWVTTVFSGTGL